MTIRDLHNAAMALADDAEALRREGNADMARATFADAYDLERQAADAADEEPSRGILYRSAAWLALDAGRADLAADAVTAGLRGKPHPDIAAELKRAGITAALLLAREPR